MKTFYLIIIILASFLIHKAEASQGEPVAYFHKVVASIYKAEGGDKTRFPYGIVSVKAKSKEHARQICFQTVKNNWHRWTKAGRKEDFILFLQRRYCPVGCDNDKGTNRFWYANVKKFLGQPSVNVVMVVEVCKAPPKSPKA